MVPGFATTWTFTKNSWSTWEGAAYYILGLRSYLTSPYERNCGDHFVDKEPVTRTGLGHVQHPGSTAATSKRSYRNVPSVALDPVVRPRGTSPDQNSIVPTSVSTVPTPLQGTSTTTSTLPPMKVQEENGLCSVKVPILIRK